MKFDHRKPMGDACEAIAAEHLSNLGYAIRHRQFRCRLGEVDLICEDGPTLVFVEVKARRGDRFGTGCEAVGPRKQARLARIAELYLVHEPDRPCRFDVVTISWRHGAPNVEHLANAFP